MDVPGGGKITNAEYPVINNDGDIAGSYETSGNQWYGFIRTP